VQPYYDIHNAPAYYDIHIVREWQIALVTKYQKTDTRTLFLP
jgi:hypothetical protein